MDYKDIANRLRKWANGETCEDCPAKTDLAFCAADTIRELLSKVEELEARNKRLEEAWSKEHTVKTMAQDFFEKFPNAPKRIDGGPASCPWMCGYCEDDCRHFSKCIDCWNRPLEEYRE